MQSLNLIHHTGGDLETNAYILRIEDSSGEGSSSVLCFDAPEGTLKVLKSRQLRPDALILTHGHFDHITEAALITQEFGCPIFIHPEDAFMIENPSIFSVWGIGGIIPIESWHPLEMPPRGHAKASIARIAVDLFHIPGHSPGSVAIYISPLGVLFSGDILFAGGVGRWDLPGGNKKTLIDGIHRHLLPLPDATRVFPGHGPATTIGIERHNNPYIA